MKQENTKTVTRFAPSPTGFMHIGGIRTAIYAWAFAKQNKGTFILRIEDTDKEREIKEATPHIIKSLKWLGIDWDEGVDIGGPNAPYLQSERLDIYKKYAQILIDKGFAYTDVNTKKDLEGFRKGADELKKPFLFRNHRPKNTPIWDGTKSLRFKVNNIKRYYWNDIVFGDLSGGEESLDDFILIKSDGYPTYNFAHIVDDIEMGVTHVMRGQEFISSTPKYLSLYEALGIKPPLFVTLPPIMANDGKKKLSKRDGAKDILQYKEDGYLPQAMLNFLILIGWNPGDDKEIFSKDEFIKDFDIKKIQHSGGKFNEEKLDWMNKEYLKKLSEEEKYKYVDKYLPEDIKKLDKYNEKYIHKLTPLILERISKSKDIIEMYNKNELSYFFKKPTYNKDNLFYKSTKIPLIDKYNILKNYLTKSILLLEEIEEKDFTYLNIKNKLWPYAEKVGKGDLLWPIRFSLSGKEKSPDPFVLAGILGRKETIERLSESVKILS